MWDFAFSYIGAAVLIVLLFLSLFAFWIYGTNVRSSASKILLELGNNAVQLAKTDRSFAKECPSFVLARRNAHYLRRDLMLGEKKVSQPIGAFLSDSIYHCANVFFAVILFEKLAGKRFKHDVFELIARIALFIGVLNLVWACLLGAWIIVGAILGSMVLLMVLELIVFQGAVNAAQAETVALLIKKSGADKAAEIRSYCKYQRLFLLRKYAMCFTQPFVEAGAFLWEVGKDSKQL